MIRVWVTRDEPADGPLSRALSAAGLVAVLEPVIERRLLSDAAEEIGRLGPDDWLVLTSVYSIENVAQSPARVPRVAVVGENSRRAALRRGLRVELLAPDRDGASLFRELSRRARGRRVCYPRSSLAEAPILGREVELISPVMYDTAARAFDKGILPRIDVIAVASPSAVEAIAAHCGCGELVRPFASIGPTTTRALRDCGWAAWAEARSPTFESLAAAIIEQTGGPQADTA